MNTAPASFRLGWGALLIVFIVLLASRFAPHPSAVLVADDWANFARSASYASTADAIRVGLQDPNRPVSMAALDAFFRASGGASLPFTLVSVVCNTLLVWLVMAIGLELTASRLAALAAGLALALLPNLVETYHWSTQIVNELACALVGYAASAWCWVRHVRTGRVGWLIPSAAAYAVALFSYEAGVFIPAAFAMLLLPVRGAWLRSALRLAPFAAVVLAYGAWRVTDALGTNQSWRYPPHMQAGLSAYALVWNGWQFLHWWIGEHLIQCVLAGWDGFMQLTPWLRRGLLVANVALVALAGIACRAAARAERSAPPARAFTLLQVGGFVAVWIAASVAPLLISYTASRLNVLPAIGIVIGLGALIARRPGPAWFFALMAPMWISLASNQGTTEQYRQAGEFNQRVYRHLETHRAEWTGRTAIVFDTSGIRERQTRGLLSPASDHEQTWAFYGNALLFRGFVPRGMIEHLSGTRLPGVRILHDVENGVRRDGEVWRWHERFDPTRPHATPIADVFHVDLSSVTR